LHCALVPLIDERAGDDEGEEDDTSSVGKVFVSALRQFCEQEAGPDYHTLYLIRVVTAIVNACEPDQLDDIDDHLAETLLELVTGALINLSASRMLANKAFVVEFASAAAALFEVLFLADPDGELLDKPLTGHIKSIVIDVRLGSQWRLFFSS